MTHFKLSQCCFKKAIRKAMAFAFIFTLTSCTSATPKQSTSEDTLNARGLARIIHYIDKYYYQEIDQSNLISIASRTITDNWNKSGEVEEDYISELIKTSLTETEEYNRTYAKIDAQAAKSARKSRITITQVYERAVSAMLNQLDGRSRIFNENDIVTQQDELKEKPYLDYKKISHFNYIRINELGLNTDIEFIGALENLDVSDEKDTNKIVIDLRDCHGGLLESAIKIADVFIGKGAIATIKGKNEKSNQVFEASTGSPFENRDVLVLINKETASGAEIIAGALQQHNSNRQANHTL